MPDRFGLAGSSPGDFRRRDRGAHEETLILVAPQFHSVGSRGTRLIADESTAKTRLSHRDTPLFLTVPKSYPKYPPDVSRLRTYDLRLPQASSGEFSTAEFRYGSEERMSIHWLTQETTTRNGCFHHAHHRLQIPTQENSRNFPLMLRAHLLQNVEAG